MSSLSDKNQAKGTKNESFGPLMPHVPQDRVARADMVPKLHEAEANDDGFLGFTARVFTQMCLPYRDPLAKNPALPAWTRKNGNVSLSVEPVAEEDPRTGEWTRKMPYGKYPRLLLPWLTTQIVRNQSDREKDGSLRIEFSASLPKLLEELGQSWGGKQGRLLIDQVPRLFGATIRVTEHAATEHGAGFETRRFVVADGYSLWWSNDDQHLTAGGVFGNTVTVSPSFVQDVLDTPIPIDLRAIAWISKSGPMAMDVLAWMNYRLPAARRPSLVTWEQLHLQFGAQYDLVRQFKAALLKKLPIVKTIYPDARFEVEADGLRLFPSKPMVARKAIQR